jgi:ribosomal protein S18 acetylase RimI-like enzyme
VCIVQQCLKEYLGDVVKLNIEVQRIHAEHHPELFKSDVCPLALHQFYEELLQDENQYIQIAINDRCVVGYIWAELVERKESLFTHPVKRLKINHISVSEQYKNSGIGNSLIAAVEKLAQERHVSEIVLDVWQFNESAIKFFETKGFKVFNINMWKPG